MSQGGTHPPEELLKEPPGDAAERPGKWLVVAQTRRVNRDWEAVIDRAPESALRWYKYLSTGGDRIYYVPDESKQKVVVCYKLEAESVEGNSPYGQGRISANRK